jgi:hypothetical protein
MRIKLVEKEFCGNLRSHDDGEAYYSIHTKYMVKIKKCWYSLFWKTVFMSLDYDAARDFYVKLRDVAFEVRE